MDGCSTTESGLSACYGTGPQSGACPMSGLGGRSSRSPAACHDRPDMRLADPHRHARPRVHRRAPPQAAVRPPSDRSPLGTEQLSDEADGHPLGAPALLRDHPQQAVSPARASHGTAADVHRGSRVRGLPRPRQPRRRDRPDVAPRPHPPAAQRPHRLDARPEPRPPPGRAHEAAHRPRRPARDALQATERSSGARASASAARAPRRPPGTSTSASGCATSPAARPTARGHSARAPTRASATGRAAASSASMARTSRSSSPAARRTAASACRTRTSRGSRGSCRSAPRSGSSDDDARGAGRRRDRPLALPDLRAGRQPVNAGACAATPQRLNA